MGKKNNIKKNAWLICGNNEKLLSGLKTVLIVALVVIMFYPPYLQGLFFEKHILPTAIFVYSLFIVFCIYKWLKNDFTLFKTPIDYIALGFSVVYFISILVAVHTRSAIIELIKYCMYFAVFYVVSEVADNRKTKLVFLWTIVVSAVGVSVISIDAAIGGNFVQMLNNLFNRLGTEGVMFFGLFEGGRIFTTLQYPNTAASYLMAVFILVTGLLIKENRLWIKAICGMFSYVLFLTFMLTQSRGAQILFPVVLIFIMIISPKGNRIKSTVHTALLTLPAIIVSFLVLPYLSGTDFSLRAFGYIFIGMIISIVLSLIVQFIGDSLQKINWRVYTVLVLVLVVVLLIGGNKIIHNSIPLELSHKIDDADDSILVMRNVALTPNKSYMLSYSADTTAIEQKPYIYYVEISVKTMRNIQFGGRTQLVYRTINDVSKEERRIEFTVPEDSELVNITFVNYYAGTGVILSDVKILDSQTGKIVKEIVLKNKYNLENIIDRFDNIRYDKSLISRLIFYKDGLKIFCNHWLLGGGGGAWEYLYHQYQSYNYPSTQAHNYLLQLGIETGLPGILVLCCLVVFLLFIFRQYYKKQTLVADGMGTTEEKQDTTPFMMVSVTTAIATLFMHALIDFDFSEGAMLLLFWQLIAVFKTEAGSTLTYTEMIPLYGEKTSGRKNKSMKLRAGMIGMWFFAIASFILLVIATNFTIGSNYAKKAYNSLRNNQVEEAITNISKAIDTDKYNEKYVIGYNPIPSRVDIKTGLADILLMKQKLLEQKEQAGENITQAETTIFQRQIAALNNQLQRIEKNTSNNINLNNNLASYYLSTGRIDKGIEYMNQGIKLFPFEPAIWYPKVNIYYQLMGSYYNNEDYENAEKYLSSALEVITEASKANEKNIDPFLLGEDAVKRLQNIQYIKDNWNQKEMIKVNDIIHYTIPFMDVNLDGMPDQWMIDNPELISMKISKLGIDINPNEKSYISTQYPLRLVKEKTYTIEVKLDRPVESVTYEVLGAVEETAFAGLEDNRFMGEFTVNNDPIVSGNPLRIYFGSDCIVKSIVVMEKGE